MNGRIIAIDYGGKRTGIAVTDELQIFASPLTTVETPLLMDFLKNYIAIQNVVGIVVGIPKHLNGDDAAILPRIEQFIQDIAIFQLPIYRIDERFTSKIAAQTIAHSGKKKESRKEKGLLDKVSAAVILQTFLEMKQNAVI